MAVGSYAVGAARTCAAYVRPADHEELALEGLPLSLDFVHLVTAALARALAAVLVALVAVIVVRYFREQRDLSLVALVRQQLAEA